MSNLPPGVGPNDIPGNRPEDVEAENFLEKVDAAFYKEFPEFTEAIEYVTVSDDLTGAFQHYIELVREIAYADGYNQGMADEALSRDMEEQDG